MECNGCKKEVKVLMKGLDLKGKNTVNLGSCRNRDCKRFGVVVVVEKKEEEKKVWEV